MVWGRPLLEKEFPTWRKGRGYSRWREKEGWPYPRGPEGWEGLIWD